MRDQRESGSTLGGLFLIGLGVFFLLGQFMNGIFWHYLWPMIIVAFGLLFFAGMIIGGRDRNNGGLAIPGTLFVTLGLIFFYQTLFNHWASWAYIWTLVAPASVGLGLIIFGWWNRRPHLYQPGLLLIGIGLCLFVLLGGFFELLIGIAGFSTPGRILWPVMIILLGVFLLVQRSMRGIFDAWPFAPRGPATHATPPAGEQKNGDGDLTV